MSSDKIKRIEFRASNEDKEKIIEMAKKYDCSEGYIIRKAIKELYERVKEEK